ncbi:uncharacterized protein BCR38DRAFT_487413 [Pseudomassariella vexata]|uniref:Uncharacterized protein n=1 Tax=Pseudomassariella vexata TaxID=1141098 RepID=A0A1Y2DQU1_9PEZI|nr:uncharacterized protein BCR38DRAFT_487413 [Pseudomassariella vexata]ORY61672.1 hypothetical protein BCR38DRAFT_487413 [Pseudomassariella vexata]
MSDKNDLTARELEVSGLAWLCVGDSFPKIHLEKLAQVANINAVKTASNNWCEIKKKIGNASANGDTGLTAREFEIAGLAWQCVVGGMPKVDLKKLQQVSGINTLKTTSNKWWAIKKKLAAKVNATSSSGPSQSEGELTTPATPANSTSGRRCKASASTTAIKPAITKKRKATSSPTESTTPAITKKRKTSVAAAADYDSDGDGDDDEAGAPVATEEGGITWRQPHELDLWHVF